MPLPDKLREYHLTILERGELTFDVRLDVIIVITQHLKVIVVAVSKVMDVLRFRVRQPVITRLTRANKRWWLFEQFKVTTPGLSFNLRPLRLTNRRPGKQPVVLLRAVSGHHHACP